MPEATTQHPADRHRIPGISRRAGAFRIGVTVLGGFQALALLFAGGAVVVEFLRGDSTDPGSSVFLTVVAVAAAAALVGAIRGMWHTRRWAISVLITWQIFQILLGWSLIDSSGWVGVLAVGWGLLMMAGLVFVVSDSVVPRQ